MPDVYEPVLLGLHVLSFLQHLNPIHRWQYLERGAAVVN